MTGKVICRLLVAVSLVAVTGCSTDPTPSAPSMADLKQQVSADLVPGTPADCDGQDFVAGFVDRVTDYVDGLPIADQQQIIRIGI